jgi:hypothetical protein
MRFGVVSSTACGIIACAAVFGAPRSASGQFTITRWDDRPTTQTFITQQWVASIDKGEVVADCVLASGSLSIPQIVRQVPGPAYSTVWTQGDPVPGTTATMSTENSRPPIISNGETVFAAQSSLGSGIYISRGGQVFRGIDAGTNTPIPGGSGYFSSVGLPSIHNGTVVFLDSPDSQYLSVKGVYTSGPLGLAKIADTSTPVPGGTGNFTGFKRRPDIYGSNVTFIGTYGTGQEGVFLSNGSTITRIAGTGSAIPTTTTTFLRFFCVSISSGGVTFVANDTTGLYQGVFTTIGGTLRVVADSRTTLPGYPSWTNLGFGPSDATYSDSSISSSGNRVVFLAYQGILGYTGLFMWEDGTITKVAGAGDMLPGMVGPTPVERLTIGPRAIDGDSIVFSLVTGSAAPIPRVIYVARRASASAENWSFFR